MALPLEYILAAAPTLTPPLAVTIPASAAFPVLDIVPAVPTLMA